MNELNSIDLEKLEVLDGSRRRNREARLRAAVRFQDLDAILATPRDLQSKQITAAPTQADYNALQADLASVHRRLLALSETLTSRLVEGR